MTQQDHVNQEPDTPQKTAPGVCVDRAVRAVLAAKQHGRPVVVWVGGHEDILEGVTVMTAELMYRGLIDGVVTTSTMIGHEMAGVMEKVKVIDVGRASLEGLLRRAGIPRAVAYLAPEVLEQFQQEMDIDISLYRMLLDAPGESAFSPAGFDVYPTGLRTEVLSREIGMLAAARRVPFERLAGYGADSMTMMGAGARLGIPVLVPVSQTAGDISIAPALGGSIPPAERNRLVSTMMERAAVIIMVHRASAPSALCQVAATAGKTIIHLTPETDHDGAFECGTPASTGEIVMTGNPGALWTMLAYRCAGSLGITLECVTCRGEGVPRDELWEWMANAILPADRQAVMRAHREMR